MRLFSILLIAITMCAVAHPAIGALHGIDVLGNLYSISTADGSATLIGNTGITRAGSLEYRALDGMLYSITTGSAAAGSPPDLYKIDPSDATTSLVGSLTATMSFEGGLVIAPDGTAYAVSQGNAIFPELYTIDLDTALDTTVATMTPPLIDINGLMWRSSDGLLVGLDSFSNTLVTIHPVTGATTTLATASGTAGSTGGIADDGTTGYYATSGDNTLYSFDPSSGADTLIGTITGLLDQISGLAFFVEAPDSGIVPEPATGALCVLSMFVLMRRRRSPRS